MSVCPIKHIANRLGRLVPNTPQPSLLCVCKRNQVTAPTVPIDVDRDEAKTSQHRFLTPFENKYLLLTRKNQVGNHNHTDRSNAHVLEFGEFAEDVQLSI